jgi:hypothetical protein
MATNDEGRFTFNNKNNSNIIQNDDDDDVIFVNSNRESKNNPKFDLT